MDAHDGSTDTASRLIFNPASAGALRLPNRIVMAPMTRNRAGAGNVPTPLMATYYRQRAGAGLIVTEGSQVSPEGVGYPNTPGSTRVFLLRRYNGKHAHTNKIEREKIDDFHIHEATERYQAIGPKEEGYAVPTKRYGNLTAALACLLKDCNFREPPEAQQSLFPSR